MRNSYPGNAKNCVCVYMCVCVCARARVRACGRKSGGAQTQYDFLVEKTQVSVDAGEGGTTQKELTCWRCLSKDSDRKTLTVQD